MPTTSEKHRGRIAKLMSDPRYWNDAHPEHPQVVADAQRAFKDAYPESSSDDQTSTGTVHVRAYTRTVDGKEVDVSAYDRTQQVAFHPPGAPQSGRAALMQDIAEGPFHKGLKNYLAQKARERGDTVETEVDLTTLDGVSARIDILGKTKDGELYGFEVKTDAYDLFSLSQQKVYELLDIGNHVYSNSPRIRSFGFEPGQPLPPICPYGALVRSDSTVQWGPLTADPRCAKRK